MVRRAAGRNGAESTVVDIFDEVEEELRAERAQRLLKQYGGVMIAAAVLVVVGVGAWQGWGWWQARRDLTVAGQYLSAMSTADTAGQDKAKQKAAASEFEHVANTGPAGYRTLARLRAAALLAQNGDITGASHVWDAVAADGSAQPLLRDLASLLWAEHQIDTADPGMLEGRLKPLTNPDNPWHSLAQEQMAVLDLRLGKKAAAKTALRQVAQDVTAPEGVRGRAAALLTQLGT